MSKYQVPAVITIEASSANEAGDKVNKLENVIEVDYNYIYEEESDET